MSADARAGRRPHRLPAALAGLLAALAIGTAAQPPVEEEDPKGGVKRRVTVTDDPVERPPRPDGGPGSPPDVRLDELARAAEDATHPALKELFQRHTVPFDRLYTKGEGNVRPIEHSRANPLPNTDVYVLGKDGRPTAKATVNSTVVRKVDYFEEVVLAEANKLLALQPAGTAPGPGGWSAADQFAAAERLLAAALRFHDYARERNVRKGRGWDEVRKPLADRLREVRLQGLKNAVASGDWPRAREAGTRLGAAYPKDAAVGAEVATARVLEAKRLLASEKHFDHVTARGLLDEFEASYPGQGGEPVQALRAELTRLAQSAFSRARDKKNSGDLAAARDALTRAVALDPTVPGVREMRRELRTGYQTLYVGVRQFPEAMSPATARLDSEKQAVELLFEGLLSEVPDDAGGARYGPAAATGMPAVVPGGREFGLRTFDPAATGRYGFESQDVVGTLKLMGRRPDTWAGYPLAWFDELPTPKDNATVRVGFRQGHPDPRALLTFKLLPARWMEGKGMAADDPGFAEAPLGTGPFRLQSVTRPETGPREAIFVDNPLYGRWRDRTDQPLIKEVRLKEAAKIPDVVEAFQQGSLHVLTDVPTLEAEKLRGPLTGHAQDFTAANNRRVHILALNMRRPSLQSKGLRQGLLTAINREAVLNDVFRAGRPDVHRPMTGPFPPTAWATSKGPGGQTVPLVNSDLALTRIRTYLFELSAKAELSLLYPDDRPPLKPGDDPKARERCEAELACQKIKAQIEGLFKPEDRRKLAIVLEPLPTRELLLRVEDEHRYDLAYVPFDYPDDWYPFALGAMLDPQAAERGGRNWFGFGAKGTGADADDARLVQLLAELRAYREFGALASRTAEVQRLFNECVPFVPLWQLDRHVIVRNGLKVFTDDPDNPVSPRALNPTTLFQGIARWRLD